MITNLAAMGMAGLLAALREVVARDGASASPALPPVPHAGGPADAQPARPVLPGDRLRWSFSNGNVIYRGGSRTPIDPQSAEGRTIEAILQRRRRDREANARQRAYVAALRQSAIPRAVVEGRAGLDAIRLGPGLQLSDLFTQRTSR